MFVNTGVKVRGWWLKPVRLDIEISKMAKYFLNVDFQNNSYFFKSGGIHFEPPKRSRLMLSGIENR